MASRCGNFNKFYIARYIHERLAQCPEQEALEGAAQKLAAAAGRPWPVVGPLEVGHGTPCTKRVHPTCGSPLHGAPLSAADKTIWCAAGCSSYLP